MSRDSRTILGVSIALVVLMSATFIGICVTSKRFLVGDGYFSHDRDKPSFSQSRDCIGYRYTPPDSRDGFFTHCIGAPVGPWKCYATLPDGGPRWEIPCD